MKIIELKNYESFYRKAPYRYQGPLSFLSSNRISIYLFVPKFRVNFLCVILKYFVELSHLTYRKLDEIKVVTQPVKIKRRLDPFETKIERCE